MFGDAVRGVTTTAW